MVKIKDLKEHDFFILKCVRYPNESQVYVRGKYVRSEKKYSCYKFNDISSERLFSGDKLVFINFVF